MTHVNIDGDVINYSVGFASQTSMYEVGGKQFEISKDATAYAGQYGIDVTTITPVVIAEPISFALSSAKRLIERIKKACNATSYTVLLTGDVNFRDDVATIQKYKGNRKSSKPVNFLDIKKYLIDVQGAEVVEGEEADDQLSIRAVKNGDTIATIDKDLNNTAGVHYNWMHDNLYEVSAVEADRNFHKQLFTGDSTDNIPGMFRITGKRASKKYKDAIDEMVNPVDMYKYVFDVYTTACEEGEVDIDVEATLIEIGRLLWMRREEGEMWLPTKGEV